MPQDGARIIGEDSEVPPVPEEEEEEDITTGLEGPPTRASPATHFEKGSDFPVGNPLPCVLVSTFPQCTATWQSLCSTILQYSCCENAETQLTLTHTQAPSDQRVLRTLAR